MKRVSSFGKLLFNIAVLFALTLAVGVGLEPITAVPALAFAGVFTVFSVIVQTAALLSGKLHNKDLAGLSFMAIQREIWEETIVANLFKNNEFITRSFNADQYVLQGKVVHIPNAGAKPGVKVNRSLLPAQITQRTDVDITYTLDEITTDPVHLPNADTAELSYDKRVSLLTDHNETIQEVAGDLMLRKWAPQPATNSGKIIRTTGSAILAHLDGATGNRKAFVVKDLIAAQKWMNKQSIPKNGRCALFSAEMMSQLKEALSITQERDFSTALNLPEGAVGRLLGFDIYERADTLTYKHDTTTPTLVAYGAAGDTDHCDSVICWQENSVERALGQVKFFEDLDNPTMYGDVYSSLLRLGGRLRRADGKGAIAIVQDTNA